jgi:hypothetical protein
MTNFMTKVWKKPLICAKIGEYVLNTNGRQS